MNYNDSTVWIGIVVGLGVTIIAIAMIVLAVVLYKRKQTNREYLKVFRTVIIA